MASVRLTNALRAEYRTLFSTLEIRPDRLGRVDGVVDRLLANEASYQAVAADTGAPWYFVAAVHSLEASLRFDRHLHNGDPLTARTRRVPEGRPRTGEPPFSWEESAADALRLRRLDRVERWSIEHLLHALEGYNGWGYRLYHAHVKSPYLWCFSNHYHSGKYIADGTWSDTAVSRQCGAAVLIKRLQQRGAIALPDGRAPRRRAPLRYSTAAVDRADDLQRFLNTFPNVALHVDSRPGRRTSDAFQAIFGHYLDGDPRQADAGQDD